MSNRIEKFLEDWQKRDAMLLQFNGGNPDVLKNRHYMKVKHKETRDFLAKNKGKLTGNEKVWVTILSTGNRHLEKELYPRRITRYFRRGWGGLIRVLKARASARRESRMLQQSNIFKSPLTQGPQSLGKTTTSIKDSQAEKPITRISQKNKYAAIQSLKIGKGLTPRH